MVVQAVGQLDITLVGDDLFDVQRKKKRAKTPPAPDGAVQRLIGVYVAGYEARFHEKPIIRKQDGAALKALVHHAGVTVVERRLQFYLTWDDPFALKSGLSLTVFRSQWNQLAALLSKTTPPRPAVPDAEATTTYLKRLRSKA